MDLQFTGRFYNLYRWLSYLTGRNQKKRPWYRSLFQIFYKGIIPLSSLLQEPRQVLPPEFPQPLQELLLLPEQTPSWSGCGG